MPNILNKKTGLTHIIANEHWENYYSKHPELYQLAPPLGMEIPKNFFIEDMFNTPDTKTEPTKVLTLDVKDIEIPMSKQEEPKDEATEFIPIPLMNPNKRGRPPKKVINVPDNRPSSV